MTPYIIFNGTNSSTLGVIVEELPTFQRPARSVTRYNIAGADQPIEIDDGGYTAYQTTFKINCNGVALETVFNWLTGSGWLISSDEPERMAWATLDGQIKATRFRAGAAWDCFDSLTVTAWISPYRYITNVTDSVFTSFPATLTNPTAVYSRPRIKIEGEGDFTVTISGQLLEFEGISGGIIIDSELQDCINLAETALLNESATFDDFPTLQSGANTIDVTGNVSKITVTPRWRVL